MNITIEELIKLAIKGVELEILEKKKSLKTGENILYKRSQGEKDTCLFSTNEVKEKIFKIKNEIKEMESLQDELDNIQNTNEWTCY